MKNNKEWVNIYQEIANKLLEYKDNRKELIDIIYNIFSKIEGVNLAKLEDDGEGNSIKPYDIDPFTIFALFNKTLSWDKRIKIIQGFKDEFSLKSQVPEVFEGIPVVNAIKAVFYSFADEKGEDDIDNLWNLFVYALEYSKNKSDEISKNFIDYFNKVITQKGVKWNITMGLYWIMSYDFINLDATNRDFLKVESNIGKCISDKIKNLNSLPSGSEYLSICTECKIELNKGIYEYKDFIELSYAAYIYAHQKNYWLYAPGEGAKFWDEFYKNGTLAIGWNKITDLRNFNNKDDIKKELQRVYEFKSPFMVSLALWQFANEMNVGDVVFVKNGVKKIIGMGVVKSDYFYDETKYYPHIREIDWIKKGEWSYPKGQLPLKTLTKVTDDKKLINTICELVENSEPLSYTEEDFLSEVYISEEKYDALKYLLNFKKNLIVEGAPGTGKTFIAKRLAYSLMGSIDPDRVKMVQFHQSYSYEDFIMGYKPSSDGFELKKGSFYNFCKKAEEDTENDYFFIIDEINRGNLSKIFGELFMLIENDKRGEENKIQLLYSGESFFIPKNLYIIGLMNTSDRSLAMIDYALRRRFVFFNLNPGFNSNGFKHYQESLDNKKFDKLIHLMCELNDKIKMDSSLGEGFTIGHSYFSNIKPDEDIDTKLRYIVEYEIIPLLKEYWFDEPEKVENWSNQLRSVVM